MAEDESEELALRALKSVSCYARGVAVFCLGETQTAGPEDQKDKMSGGINLYYGMLHIGVAVLDLNPKHTFAPKREFIMPDCTRIEEGHRRLTQLGHGEVTQELLKFGGYGRDIGEVLNKGREIRENFSYGPFTKLHAPQEIRILYVRSDLERDVGAGFSSLAQLVDEMEIHGRPLVDQYPSYLRDWISVRERRVRIAIARSVAIGLAPAPYSFGPMPPNIKDVAQERILAEFGKLGGDLRRIANSLQESWTREQWRKERDSGARVDRLGYEGRWG